MRQPTLGIIGEGQLAQLLGHSAYHLSLSTRCFSQKAKPPAEKTTTITRGNLNNEQQVTEFINQCDVVTFETEKIPAKPMAILKNHMDKPMRPSLLSLEVLQNRIREKQLFDDLGIPTPDTFAICSYDDLKTYRKHLNNKGILKKAYFGYDGKGQLRVDEQNKNDELWHQLAGQPAVLQELVEFDYEVSMIGARNKRNGIVFYPLIYNNHENGILKRSFFPYHHATLQAQAERYLTHLLEHLDYVGVLTMEFFVRNQTLIANEVAPRVHNSGHTTLEGANCSQFENHIRAICELPLIKPIANGFTVMHNIIGDKPQWSQWPDIPTLRYYDYGKESKPGRKLGHITINAFSESKVLAYEQNIDLTRVPLSYS
jgi:5-(carboxyamino)imidazole ribonucleotide synthase